MSDQEWAVDQTQYLEEGLTYFRTAAEQGNGHTMEPWLYQDASTGHLISSRCAQCGAMIKITIPNTYDLTRFPPSAQAAASTALSGTCRNPEVRRRSTGYIAPE